MKEHLLNDGDRAALQGMIPLAGALGAGTIFALFFGNRRRGSGIAVFELFAIVAVLAAVGTTAYLALSLLHANQAIGDRTLTQTAMPLLFALSVLVLVSVLARLPGSAQRVFALVPLVLLAGFISLLLAGSSWSLEPDETFPMAVLVLGVGGLTALAAWGADRLDRRWDRKVEQRRFVRLSAAGYRVAQRDLLVAVPGRGGKRPNAVSCWVRKDRVYLDRAACRRLREQTEAGWDRLAADRGRPPEGATVLTRVHSTHLVPGLVRKRLTRFWTLAPGADEEIRVREVGVNDDGLFDVTDLRLVQLAAGAPRPAYFGA